MHVRPMMTLTDQESQVVIGIRGDFDLPAAEQLQGLVSEYVAQGGAVDDLVVDLRSTTRCRTSALERLASLVSAGMRLRAAERHRRGGRFLRGSRASCGA